MTPAVADRGSLDYYNGERPRQEEGAFVMVHHGHPHRHNDEADDEQQRQMKRWRIIAFAVAALLITAVTVDALTNRHLERVVSTFVEWLAQHPLAGVFAVILVYTVATICFVPGSLLTIGVGYAFGRAYDQHLPFGVFLASAAVFAGASAGSVCCLLLGRYLFRAPVLRLAQHYPVFRAVDRALRGNGFRIMLLLRLSPLIPYNALDYLSGVTSISLAHYSLALLGLLPGTIAFCYVGATASSLAAGAEKASASGSFRTAVLVLGLLFALAGAALASYYSKLELDKILLEQQQQQQQQQQEEMRDEDYDYDSENPIPAQYFSSSHDHLLVAEASALPNSNSGVGGAEPAPSRQNAITTAFGNKYRDIAPSIDHHGGLT